MPPPAALPTAREASCGWRFPAPRALFASSELFQGPFDIAVSSDGWVWTAQWGWTSRRGGGFRRTRLTDGLTEVIESDRSQRSRRHAGRCVPRRLHQHQPGLLLGVPVRPSLRRRRAALSPGRGNGGGPGHHDPDTAHHLGLSQGALPLARCSPVARGTPDRAARAARLLYSRPRGRTAHGRTRQARHFGGWRPAPGINAVIGAASIRALLEGVEVVAYRGRLRGTSWKATSPTRGRSPSRTRAASTSAAARIIGTSRANPTTSAERLETTVQIAGAARRHAPGHDRRRRHRLLGR